MGGLEKALQRLCTSARHGSQIKRVSSVGRMLAVDGVGQSGYVLPHEKWRADVLLGGLLGYHRSWAWQLSPDLG